MSRPTTVRTTPLTSPFRAGMLSDMASVSEARRHQMYNELVRVIGTEPADTLMAYLPTHEGTALATKADIDGLRQATKTDIDGLRQATRADVGRLDNRMDSLDNRMESFESRMGQFDVRLEGVNQRLDRLFLTMLTGFIGVIGAMIAGNFVG